MVMQVKNGKMVVGVELEIDAMYQVQDSLHHRKSYYHGKYIKKSAADHHSNDRSVRGDTTECSSVSEISI